MYIVKKALNISYIIFFSILFFSCNNTDEKPNIVWLVTEDNSIHYMNLYTKGGAEMPAISALANQGVVFDNAFSNAPVCSVARSTIITGAYAPRIGTQYHRKMSQVKLPNNIKPLPIYLKQAGYYVTNNAKEDYNFIKEEKIWDESSLKATYKNRKDGQPFFHVQNFHNTHEGKLHFNEKQLSEALDSNNLDSIKPFPYHPDTPTFRYTQSLLHNHHKDVDKEMGKFIENLEKEGLMENTIIFYYGDHGGVLPRSKGYLYESGLNVPMVVRIPKKWKKLSPFKGGTRTSSFVDFVDLVPTVLSLAGIKIPEGIDGTPFMGKGLKKSQIEKQDTTFGYADRFDEKYDLVRSVRKGKYKYIRNYQPFNLDGLYNYYRYKMLAYKEWYKLYQEKKLNKIQSRFFNAKSPEALYDIEKDPHEINNLAQNAQYKETLINLRETLNNHVISQADLSFFPEPYFLENGLEDALGFGQENKNLIKEIVTTADLSLQPYNEVSAKIKDALNNTNPWIRYWGLITCSSFRLEAKEHLNKIKSIFENDSENLVKIRAAEYLLLNDLKIDASKINDLLKNANSEAEANLMLNTLALIKTKNPDYKLELNKSVYPDKWFEKENGLVNRRINYLTNNE
ncbi:MAG: sulfatase [Flavobacteriaceae bacterium]|nr:sulfatase [Flavobacteriaceae bacterium]|tara:strand:+ start:11554 stop:13425 length:1872 start_codon:yes stop_codon:yes gene_type:complete